MTDEVYSFALRNTLNEIQKVCPDIKNAFIFKENGEITAADENTPEKTIVQAINAFDTITEKAGPMDGVEALVINGNKNRMNISMMEDLYMVTVASKQSDPKYVNTIIRVLIPTITKLVEKISADPPAMNLPSANPEVTDDEPEPESKPAIPAPRRKKSTPKEEPSSEVIKEPEIENEEQPQKTEQKIEDILTEPIANQFIVENIGGLLVPADTVRVDNSLLTQWHETYPDIKVEQVEVETFGGKAVTCKVKPIKDSKYEGKGIVQMPEKIQFTLEIKKGELVRVKPVIA